MDEILLIEFRSSQRLFLNRVALSGDNLDAISQSFSRLYGEFQTEIVHSVRCTQVVHQPYLWADPSCGRSQQLILFFHADGLTVVACADDEDFDALHSWDRCPGSIAA